MKKYLLFAFLILTGFNFLNAQVLVEGYVFQSGNRGFLNQVKVSILDNTTRESVQETFTNIDGFFEVNIPADKRYVLLVEKDIFVSKELVFNTNGKAEGEKVFVKTEMERAPGYTFEITLANKRDSEETPVDAIRGALIEVYNNTTEKVELVLEDHPHPDFQTNLLKGNHYTVLVRKSGYLSKRMEAYVDVEGCILCFEGVGQVKPGVSDNLTEGNQNGVLLANVELEKIEEGKTFELKNIYYEFGSAKLSNESEKELQKVISIFKDNPNLLLELGSHTDSRGTSSRNLTLSEERANSAVNYLKVNGEISYKNIIARGYGETKIINKCKNGVDCSDKEHGVNRRTELTVLGVVNDFVFKSLEELKEDEKMERLIIELQNQEQIKVKKGENVEDKIKELDSNRSTSSSIKKKIVEKETKVIINETESKPKIKKIDLDSPASSKKTERDAGAGEEVTSRLNYRVIIHFTTRALDDEHAIFKDNADVLSYTSPKKYIYYSIGEFKSEIEAQVYLEKNIKSKYENAYVASYLGKEKM